MGERVRELRRRKLIRMVHSLPTEGVKPLYDRFTSNDMCSNFQYPTMNSGWFWNDMSYVFSKIVVWKRLIPYRLGNFCMCCSWKVWSIIPHRYESFVWYQIFCILIVFCCTYVIALSFLNIRISIVVMIFMRWI